MSKDASAVDQLFGEDDLDWFLRSSEDEDDRGSGGETRTSI